MQNLCQKNVSSVINQDIGQVTLTLKAIKAVRQKEDDDCVEYGWDRDKDEFEEEVENDGQSYAIKTFILNKKTRLTKISYPKIVSLF